MAASSCSSQSSTSSSAMIHSPALPPGITETRLRWLKGNHATVQQSSSASSSSYVIYWMQRSTRNEFNHALEMAITWSNHLHLPLLVLYCFVPSYPGANERGFAFLIDGLSEVQAALHGRGIRMIVRQALDKSVPETVLETMEIMKCPILITDRGYERILRAWRQEIVENASCPVLQVESDVIVPVETASSRGYPAAAIFRKVMNKHIQAHLLPLPMVQVHHPSVGEEEEEKEEQLLQTRLLSHIFDVSDPDVALASLTNIDRSVHKVPGKRGGTTPAKALLALFLRDRLKGYATHRKEAWRRHSSFLSPYLHFGHISPLAIALKVNQHKSSSPDDRRRFLDEMITWREFAINFVYYNPDAYDTYECIPLWARQTLEEYRAKDVRGTLYTLEQLEAGETNDVIWNAAQQEMVYTGYMVNYMRMYWAKQVITWTEDPAEAYRRVMYMNDKYFIDGRDCNGYSGVAWCFGLFDRPMPPQRYFGKVRSMTANGIRNKQDVDKYIQQVKDVVSKIKAARGGGGGSSSGSSSASASLGQADFTYTTPPRSNIQAHLLRHPVGSGGASGSSSGGGNGGGRSAGGGSAGTSLSPVGKKAGNTSRGDADDSGMMSTPNQVGSGGSAVKRQKTASAAVAGGGGAGRKITSFFGKKE